MLGRAVLGAVVVAAGCAGAVVFAHAVIVVGIKGRHPSQQAWGAAANLPRAAFASYFGAAGIALLSLAHSVLFFRNEDWFWLIAPQQGVVFLSLTAGWLAMRKTGKPAYR